MAFPPVSIIWGVAGTGLFLGSMRYAERTVAQFAFAAVASGKWRLAADGRVSNGC